MIPILLVDDERQVLEGLKLRLLRRFEVHTAGDGATALDVLRRNQGIVVVLSDLRMPGMSGVELLEQCRDVAPATVRMLLTGHADFESAIAAVNKGFVFRFLLKPCPPEVVDAAFDDAVEQYRIATADRDLLEAKVNEVSQRLLRAEQLATLGTLASAVGHELNNVTTVFVSLVEAVQEQAHDGKPPLGEDLDELARVGAHLKAHAQQLLRLGRPSSEPSTALDLRDVARDTLAMLQLSGKTKRLTVEPRFGSAPARVVARRTHLEQVLLNLVGNAADATAEVQGRPGHITVTIEAGVGEVRCRIDDNGCGIPADKQQTVFEPFYTTKPEGKGTGLGLPVVRQIVESYGGRVELTSRPGDGSTFTVILPAGVAVPAEV